MTPFNRLSPKNDQQKKRKVILSKQQFPLSSFRQLKEQYSFCHPQPNVTELQIQKVFQFQFIRLPIKKKKGLKWTEENIRKHHF